MMSEKLEERANELLLKMMDGLDKAGEFAVDQVPLVVQELLTWHFVISLATMVVSFMICALFVCLSYHSYKKLCHFNTKPHCEGETVGLMFLTLILVGFVLGMFLKGISSHDWLQILVAPRLYLLEYAANLAK